MHSRTIQLGARLVKTRINRLATGDKNSIFHLKIANFRRSSNDADRPLVSKLWLVRGKDRVTRLVLTPVAFKLGNRNHT